MTKKELEFLEESNAIEGVYDEDSLQQAIYAWEYLKKEKEITPGVILKLHKILMKNQKLLPNEIGYFRNVMVWVGGKPCLNALKIPEVIGNWCYDTMHSRKSAKVLHIEYEKIHPFVDGNGRTGRMLMNWTHLKKKQPIVIIHAGPEQQAYYQWFREEEGVKSDRLYIKDKVDGQEYCISGDGHFYLIDVTDQYVKKKKR